MALPTFLADLYAAVRRGLVFEGGSVDRVNGVLEDTITIDVSAGLDGDLPGTTAGDVLVWSGTAWVPGANPGLRNRYEITTDGSVTLDYTLGDYFWIDAGALTGAVNWTLPTTGVVDDDVVTVATKVTDQTITVLGGEWSSGNPGIRLNTGFKMAITYRYYEGVWNPESLVAG